MTFLNTFGTLRSLFSVILVSGIAGPNTYSQKAPAFEPGFQSRAMETVQRLASFGIHDAGSRREKGAARYIMQEMKKVGLSVTSEPFTFRSFAMEDAILMAEAENVKIIKLAINPYSTASPIVGDLAFIATTVPRSILEMNLDGKIVVVADGNSFKVASIFKRPKAVALLSPPDFERLKAIHHGSGSIRFSGRFGMAESANVVGTLAAKPGAREIIISAHYDSVRGPGANDNASGVAAMLELARFFHASALPPGVSLRFVAFGAEEAGLLGSKAYLQRHLLELQNCRLLFNIDEIGGDGAIHVDIGSGVKNVPDKIENQMPADLMGKATNDIKDASQGWLLLNTGDRALWTSSDVPEWLRSVILGASSRLGYKITEQSRTGSDHRVFVQAGIVSTDIGSDGGAEVHAPTDVPEAVHPQSIELAARVVLGVILELLHPDSVKATSEASPADLK